MGPRKPKRTKHRRNASGRFYAPAKFPIRQSSKNNAVTDNPTNQFVNPIAPLRIGPVLVDPPVLQAPMAGFTDHAYRQIVREFGGVGLMAVEMVSARSFVWMTGDQEGEASEVVATKETLADMPGRLWGIEHEPRPLAVQIWDNDPDTMARVATRLVEDLDVSVIDINFGCPVRRVAERAQSGSYLLGDPERIGVIVKRVADVCYPTPVTAKIRLGRSRDQINAIEVACAIEAAGGAALTVHGRTAADRFRGTADWKQIAAIKPHLQKIPLIGNGDLDSPDKVVDAFRQYNVDGVMIGRAAIGRPWLFAQIEAALRGEPIPPTPTLKEQRACLLRHYQYLVDRFGEKKGTVVMRKIACTYAQGRPGARAFRSQIANVSTAQQFHEATRLCFPQ